MKYGLVFILAMASNAYAKEVKDFNKVLIQNMQKDINNQNDYQFKTQAGRAPASVPEAEVDRPIKEDNKIDKNVRQIGPRDW